MARQILTLHQTRTWGRHRSATKEEMTENEWDEKEDKIEKEHLWTNGPETLHKITRAEYRENQQKSQQTLQPISFTEAKRI